MSTVQGYVETGEAAFQHFLDTIAGFDASKWDLREAPGAWSMKQLLHHFGTNTRGTVVIVEGIVAGRIATKREKLTWKHLITDALAEGFAPTVDWMVRDHEAHIGYLRALPEDVLRMVGTTTYGERSAEEFLRHYATHGYEHAEQAARIRQAVGG